MKYKTVKKLWFAVITDLQQAPKLEYLRVEKQSDQSYETFKIKGDDKLHVATTFNSVQEQFAERLIEKYGKVIGLSVYRYKMVVQSI